VPYLQSNPIPLGTTNENQEALDFVSCYFQANPAIGFRKKYLLQRLCANQLRLADLEAITRKT
jgi:hypothetical protein